MSNRTPLRKLAIRVPDPKYQHWGNRHQQQSKPKPFPLKKIATLLRRRLEGKDVMVVAIVAMSLFWASSGHAQYLDDPVANSLLEQQDRDLYRQQQMQQQQYEIQQQQWQNQQNLNRMQDQLNGFMAPPVQCYRNAFGSVSCR